MSTKYSIEEKIGSPFHNKACSSLDDWKIILSVVDY